MLIAENMPFKHLSQVDIKRSRTHGRWFRKSLRSQEGPGGWSRSSPSAITWGCTVPWPETSLLSLSILFLLGTLWLQDHPCLHNLSWGKKGWRWIKRLKAHALRCDGDTLSLKKTNIDYWPYQISFHLMVDLTNLKGKDLTGKWWNLHWTLTIFLGLTDSTPFQKQGLLSWRAFEGDIFHCVAFLSLCVPHLLCILLTNNLCIVCHEKHPFFTSLWTDGVF